jgi:EAL domain-containing protein (putative c-di-GMP-specific phosphodiesterase class I)
MGAELRDEERGERDRGTEDTVTEALARLSADPGPDDHEWLIGTPDEIIVGEPLEEVPLADESPRDDTRDGTRDDTHDDRHATGFEGDELDEAAFEAPPFDERGEDEGSPAPASSRLARDLPLAADLRTVPLVPPSAASAPLQASGVDFGAPAPARTLAASPRVTDAPALVLASRAREAVVRGLLEAGHLRVHYQPQVTPGTRQVIGVEALVRWQDEEAALRAATDLFGDGTSADAFAGATEFVLHTACADRRSWLRQVGRSWPVAVNVGLAELREPGFFDRVLRVLEANELPPAYLELEVPERALAQLGTPECEALDRAYRHGLAVAVGGFVAADAPLRVLSQVPISKLKIHRALVADLPDCAHARMVVDSILAIGRTLGVTVCAEGVETAAQAGYLDMMQCPAGQGWYYSRALDAEQLLQLVRGSGVDTVTLPLMDVEELEAHARAAGVV